MVNNFIHPSSQFQMKVTTGSKIPITIRTPMAISNTTSIRTMMTLTKAIIRRINTITHNITMSSHNMIINTNSLIKNLSLNSMCNIINNRNAYDTLMFSVGQLQHMTKVCIRKTLITSRIHRSIRNHWFFHKQLIDIQKRKLASIVNHCLL